LLYTTQRRACYREHERVTSGKGALEVAHLGGVDEGDHG
jgi:hypothetical protein